MQANVKCDLTSITETRVLLRYTEHSMFLKQFNEDYKGKSIQVFRILLKYCSLFNDFVKVFRPTLHESMFMFVTLTNQTPSFRFLLEDS